MAKRIKNTLLLTILFFVSCCTYSNGQNSKNVSINLPVVALMDIAPVGNINLSFIAPTEAGKALNNPSNNSKWLNYTSAVEANQSRIITAKLSSTISGIDIKIQAATASGAGGGTRGTSAGLITLSTSTTTIISGVGGAFTGDGVNNGHQLTISAVPNNYALLKAQTNTTVTITYTISN